MYLYFRLVYTCAFFFVVVHVQIFCTTRKGVQQTAVFLAKTLHTNIIQEEANMKLNQAAYMVQDIKIQGKHCIKFIIPKYS